jgi:glycosyltransferase involved in cell wall biosynthesis
MYVPLAIALFGSGVPVFASEHIGMQHYEGRGLERWLVKVLSKRLAAKSVPSEVIREHCARTDDCELHVLPNPLPIEEFELGLNSSPASPPVLLAVGRFMTQKNQLELIEAFANLADDFPEWVLRIVGEGEMRQELERKVAQCHVQSRVQMPGAVSAMAEEYAAASFVAMPSLWESFGLATAEALASGRPVVGFADCPGTNELIVHDQNGLLVAGGTNRVRNLEAGLRLLMSDSSLRLRLGASGPASVAKFQACQVTPVWEATFAQYATSGAVQPTGARP